MVEEYVKTVNSAQSYYKCNLCCVHGKTDAMLNHLISKKHTEKYIVSNLYESDSVDVLAPVVGFLVCFIIDFFVF